MSCFGAQSAMCVVIYQDSRLLPFSPRGEMTVPAQRARLDHLVLTMKIYQN